jgi:fibronectin-binding autotransporter adhesin
MDRYGLGRQGKFKMSQQVVLRSFLRLAVGALLAITASCFLPASAYAQTIRTWSGFSSSNWSDSGNWYGGSAPAPSTSGTLVWSGSSTGNLTSTNDISGLSAQLLFSGNTPGSVSLSGSAITLTGNSTQTVWGSTFTGTVTIGMAMASGSLASATFGLGAGSRLNLNGVISGTSAMVISTSGVGSVYLNGLNTIASSRVTNGNAYINTLANSGSAQSLGPGSSVSFGFGSGSATGNIVYTGTTAAATNKTWSLGQTRAGIVHNGGFFNDGTGAVSWAGSQTTVTTDLARTFTLGGSNADANTWQSAIKDNTGTVPAVNLTKSGAGRWVLSGTNTYSGATTVTGGLLEIASTGVTGSTSGITVNGVGAHFRYNSATALTRPLTLTQGTLSGTGTISSTGGVSVGANAILSPGNSPGTQAYTTGLTLAAGGTYVWEVNSGTGTTGVNWDLINVTAGGLNLSALSAGGKFTLDLTTLTASGSSGPMDNYTPGGSYTWRIFDANALTLPGSFGSTPYAAGTDITSLFNLVTTNWKNTAPAQNDMSVKVAANGTGIDLVVVPEPGTLALAGLGIAGFIIWRCRRRG